MIKKSRMKKMLGLFLLVSLLVLSAGCSGGDTASDDVQVIKLAHDHMTSSPFQESALELKEILEERSDGRFEVEVYPAQQLGSSREMIEAMQMGTCEMTLLPTAKFGGFDQRLTLVDLPFLFPNEDVLWEVLEGDIGQEIMSGLDEIGIKGMAFYAEGFKAFTANKKISLPEDFEGMKIRTMEAPVIMAQYSAWGANPVPIDFAEVYNSLQQKVVDGQENPLLSIHDMKFYEVQDNMIMGDHAYLSYFLSVSKAWFEDLPADLQEIVMDAVLEVQQSHKQLMYEANEVYLQNILDSGTEVTYLTEAERKAFEEASAPVYADFEDAIGSDLIDRTITFIEEQQ